ncbi:GIY-YIG nuclease family protein, partial [Deltaproteobacteria bacterium OttesenSCG-928-M10]|nr:GIY-YIG nuclease family protein [Deltaproteobacteria bacterium OttesenSCG-928-M10]
QEKEEQRRIREQMREEEKARREYEKALRDSQVEEARIQKALEKAREQVAKATEEQKEKYELQIQELMEKLQEAEAKEARAISMAQLTRAGHVYVISNCGSFGDEVLKIGMTRRLEPMDRVKELGDASVPFSFDIHAMIYCEDAPALEAKLHQKFNLARVNKVNFRKEFFRVAISDVRNMLEELGLEAKFTMTAEAREYRETLAIDNLPEAERLAKLNALMRLEEKDVNADGDEAA